MMLLCVVVGFCWLFVVVAALQEDKEPEIPPEDDRKEDPQQEPKVGMQLQECQF